MFIFDARLHFQVFIDQIFRIFDKDGGGSISTDEIKQVLSFGQNLEESVVNEITEMYDRMA